MRRFDSHGDIIVQPTLSKKAYSFRVPYFPASASETSFSGPVFGFCGRSYEHDYGLLFEIYPSSTGIKSSEKKNYFSVPRIAGIEVIESKLYMKNLYITNSLRNES